jgi:hypothetical protein
MKKRSVTYRDFRNTPGRVSELLADGKPIPLIANGTVKALLVPVEDGDVLAALDAWRSARATMALRRLQESARRAGLDTMTMDEIDEVIQESRRERRARDAKGNK